MQMRKEQTPPDKAPAHSQKGELTAPPDFTAPQQPIADFVTRPDFPDCLLGKHVMIGGYPGVVVAIVKNSIKVRSAEGFTRSFNVFGLRRIYGPSIELEPMPSSEPSPSTPPPPPAKPAPPRHEVVTEPDYSQAIIPIARLVAKADFPRCAFAKHVDIGGYAGVVVEIVGQSVKVRSAEGTTRSYNAPGLRHIYGGP
jgi:hypothetical protein